MLVVVNLRGAKTSWNKTGKIQVVQFSPQIGRSLSHLILSPKFLERHRKYPEDFTRKRTLTFPRLISFMLNMVNSSIQTELNRFFQVLEGTPMTTMRATTAAFSKARKKVSFEVFKELNTTANNIFYQSDKVKLWRGHRLIAVDGSVPTLPIAPELFSYYGKARPHSRYPAVRLSQLYDIQNKISIDVQIDSHKTGERDLAIRHLPYTKENDLVIYDRGYPAVWFFRMHLLRGVHFCTRTKLDESNIVKAFVRSRRKDQIIEFPCTEKSLRRCRKDGLPTESMKIRLIKIILSTGEIEVLMTSLLDKKRYPHKIFKKLYHLRWGIEEDYKVMKSRLNIENFSGKSVHAILQDIHAKALTKNLAAIAMIEAESIKIEKVKNRKHKYNINFTHVLSQFKDNIVRFMMDLAPDKLYQFIIKKIANVLCIVVPDRCFLRPKDKRTRVNKYPMAYKRIT